VLEACGVKWLRWLARFATGLVACGTGMVMPPEDWNRGGSVRGQETTATPMPVPPSLAQAARLYLDRTVMVEHDGIELQFSWRLLEPPADASGRRYPVVLFLHGAGERGTDNLRQLQYLPAWLAEPEERKARPCYVIAPQCRPGSRWADVAWDAKHSSPANEAPTADLAAAIAMLDEVLAMPAADPDRVYVTGMSMGGFGTWDLAARMPERFAALLVVCGGGDERVASRLIGIPTWVAHGADDRAVPVARSRTMVAALEAAGGRPTYVELPGVGHDAWTPTYRDPAVLDWLFGQRRGR